MIKGLGLAIANIFLVWFGYLYLIEKIYNEYDKKRELTQKIKDNSQQDIRKKVLKPIFSTKNPNPADTQKTSERGLKK